MPAALIFSGMAWGALLAAVGLALWGAPRQIPRLSLAIRAIRWLAGAFLLTGALLAWIGDPSLSVPALSADGASVVEGPVSRLILIAALATPPGIRRRRHSDSHPYSPWSDIMLILPALLLAGGSLLQATTSTGIGATSVLVTAPVDLAVLVCAGLGARAVGQSLSEIVAPVPHIRRSALSAAITYALLTLLVGSAALADLWQRGLVGRGTVRGGGLAGAWLAWSAVRLGPRQPLWLRAVLTVVAALLLTSVALRFT